MPIPTRLLRSALLLLGPLLAGCAKSDPTAVVPLTLRLSAAEAKWQDTKLVNYSFNSTVSCFCLDEYWGPMRVTVRAGVVTSVVDRRTGTLRPVNWRQPVDSLFALVRGEILTLPSRLDVTYDDRLGFPRRISYGRQEVDGGGVITIDSLRAEP